MNDAESPVDYSQIAKIGDEVKTLEAGREESEGSIFEKRTTNVEPGQLNYDQYTSEKYDQDIVNSIPFHRDIHALISEYVKEHLDGNERYDIVDLGVGTAITSQIIRDDLPNAKFDLVDFSEQMLEGAKKKMGAQAEYIVGDYSEIEFRKKYDVVVSVIGIHHQNSEGKRQLFAKVYGMLNPGGVFIFGDLVTYRDEHEAALNNAKHFKELVDNASDEQTLAEWAHHHMHLNDLAPIEDQIEWLEQCGFTVDKKFLKLNTALLFCTKQDEDPAAKHADDSVAVDTL